MNRTVQEVYVVTIPVRLDGTYAFALREDAEAFVAAVEGPERLRDPLAVATVAVLEAVPLIPGGGAGELIEQERE